MLLPLDCHIAETDELVNGGRSPFISTVDKGGRLCYLMRKSPLTIFGFSDRKFQPSAKNNSAQVGLNFNNHFPTTWRKLQAPTSDQLGQKWAFFRID